MPKGGGSQNTSTNSGFNKGTVSQGLGGPASTYVNNIMGQANSQIGQPAYLAKDTRQGLQSLDRVAAYGTNKKGNYQSNLRSIINRGGYTKDQLNSTNYYKDVLSGDNDQYQNLNPYASGEMLGENNPYLRRATEIAAQEAAQAANMGAAMGGVYGTAGHAGKVGSDVADIITQRMFGQYNQDVANQFQANQLQSGMQSGAASNLFNAGQSAQGNIANAYQAMQLPGQLKMYVGQTQEGYKNPWANLNAASSILSPYAGYYSTLSSNTNTGGTQTAPSQKRPLWQSVGGNALTGAAMGGLPGAAFGGLSGIFG